jgi:two-component system sensor histidine kinase KdpD
MAEGRPSPDELLKRVQAEELRGRRGKLKIFFGAAAGVGKTYAMLQAAQARKAEGVDVVAGIVETHGRRETEALLHGLEALPPLSVEYRGARLHEFDLDGALARRPALLLVDELAHSNAPGSRHPKRWEDVNELLDAGINVYTTLNVQHLESLSDIVAQITGIEVRESLPDSVLEEADEAELIDLPPDDLLKRLKEGKVYVPEQARLAVDRFFRKGNLLALRELALRATADRVNAQARIYRQEQAITGTWRTAERLLVCVSSSPFSAQLVRAARRMAAGLHAEWTAVTVAQLNLSEQDRRQLAENLALAEQLGAETAMLTGDDPVEATVSYARQHGITKIIAGKPGRLRWRERFSGSFVGNLIRASGDIDVYVIKGEAQPEEATHAAPAKAPVEWTRYLWAVLSVLACTAVGWAVRGFLAPANLIMLYLLGVVVIAARFGRGQGIVASVLSVAAFDFFFVPPRFTFAVADSPQYLVTFGVMAGTAVLISSLTARMKRQTQAANERAHRTAALYAMSRQLSSARGTQTLLNIVVSHVAETFDSEVAALMPDAGGRLVVVAGNQDAFPMNARERGVAHWVHDLGRLAGLGTDMLPGAENLYLPLTGTRGVLGVLGVRPVRAGRPLTPALLQLLEAFAAQAGLAIESDHFADEVRKTQVEAETEKSRLTLLSSVSHDLREPLSAIAAASDAMVEQDEGLDAAARRALAETIREEAARMDRQVSNLIEMTRLQSGAVKVTKEPCRLEDVVGAALSRLEKQLARHRVTTRLPANLPPVPLDVLLVEQVLVHLLENAARFTPPGTEIEISASADGAEATVEVADRGPGIPPGDEKRIFEKFYHGKAAGIGLGLTICRAAVEAHGGRIWVENRPGGGAAFRFTLPLDAGRRD